MPRLVVRAVAVGCLAVVALALAAPPALAHGRGSDATNFSSALQSVPGLAGVTWRVYGGDEYLWVSSTQDELTVLGYDDEPYLRVGPDGVFENRATRTTYENADRYANVLVPSDVSPTAPPRWVRVTDKPSYAWHDHRIHWMALALPPNVQAAPGDVSVINDEWVVPFALDGERHEVTGSLTWVPGPSPWPWVLAAVVLVGVPGLLGLRTAPSGERWPGLARPAALVLGVVALANLTNLVDDLAATPLPVGEVALAAGQTALFLGIGLFGAVRGWQAGDGAFTALGVGAGALFVGQGFLYASVLGASQTASVFPEFVTRGVVALSLAQVLPVGAVAVMGTRRLLPPPAPRGEASDADRAQGAVAGGAGAATP